MTLALLGRRSVLCMHIVSGVSRPSRLSIAVGRSLACWSLLPRGPIWCLHLFTLGDIQHEFNNIHSLGPFVAAGERIS